MLISIFLFTIAFLGCYDESTWYFVVVEINEISCIGRRWIWKDLQTRPIIKLLKHNRCFTVSSVIFAWNWEKLIFFCCVFFFGGGGDHGMIFIMFNSEKSRDNSLCPVHFSMLDTQIKIQNGPDFVSPFICLTLCNYILDHCWHAGTGLWSNGH